MSNNKLYSTGDYIDGIGYVDSNHFGLPYPATLDGSIVGAVCIKGTSIVCDMKTGKILTKKQVNNRVHSRINNNKYDYLKVYGEKK